MIFLINSPLFFTKSKGRGNIFIISKVKQSDHFCDKLIYRILIVTSNNNLSIHSYLPKITKSNMLYLKIGCNA